MKMICARCGDKGALSAKQMYWVRTLAKRATGTAPPAPTIQVGNVAGVLDLFKVAGGALKHPKIRLRSDDGRQRLPVGRWPEL
jgi:hypothetical protein